MKNNKKAKKAGRPKLAKQHRRVHVVQVRVNDSDFKALVSAAHRSKNTLSEWIRDKLLDAI